ncbi:MAG: TIGR00730 family Rossman fold protein [Roseinatronobacter sp.]
MTVLARSLCVFCGSRAGTDPRFAADARAVGEMIARHGWRLVYGAGDIGIMGEVARAAQSAGAATMGVIPTHLMQAEVGKRDLGMLVVTETMHERKKVMFTNSDAIVVLPGGAGSLDEFFEVLTWRQLGLHAKPIFLLNTAGYWSPLANLVDHIVDQGFADPSLRGFFTMLPDVATLEARLSDTLM